MKFKVRKIHPEITHIKNSWWKKIIRVVGPKMSALILLTVLTALCLFLLGLFVRFLFSGGGGGGFSFSGLAHDSYGHTNVLVLGMGGTRAEGGKLTDSIMILSFYPKDDSLSILSIPRDTFVKSEVGNRKINEVYTVAKKEFDDVQALEITKQSLADFTGIELHYIIVIDFDVFKEVVDSLGGVDIFVPEEIVDPFYPGPHYSYQTFVVRKGFQTFDGETALKYARSRKTSSDYARAKRQQQLILAIKEKASKVGLLSNFDKLREFYSLFRKYVDTDLGVSQLISLAKISMGVDTEHTHIVVLNNDPTRHGGYLYSPGQEYYGGQFVLLPEDEKEMRLFMDLSLIHADILREKANIALFNGSSIEGKARQLANRLKRLGFQINSVANYDGEAPLEKSFLKVLSKDKGKTVSFLEKFLSLTSEYVEIPSEESSENETFLFHQEDSEGAPEKIDIQIFIAK